MWRCLWLFCIASLLLKEIIIIGIKTFISHGTEKTIWGNNVWHCYVWLQMYFLWANYKFKITTKGCSWEKWIENKKSARWVVLCNAIFPPTQMKKNNEIITKYIIKEFKKRLTRQKHITRQKLSLRKSENL